MNVVSYLQQMFHQGDFQKTCLKCLDSMDTLSKELVKHDSRDNSLRDQYDQNVERWNRLKEAMDATLLSLKQLPERWKEYNARYVNVLYLEWGRRTRFRVNVWLTHSVVSVLITMVPRWLS